MKLLLLRYFAIGVAGFLGAISRYAVSMTFGSYLNVRFPVGTLFINISGSFFLGWFLTYITAHHVSDTTRLAIGVGFVGAYTTFSTYMFETTQLAEQGAGLAATANLVGSLVLGLIAVRAGMFLAR